MGALPTASGVMARYPQKLHKIFRNVSRTFLFAFSQHKDFWVFVGKVRNGPYIDGHDHFSFYSFTLQISSLLLHMSVCIESYSWFV